MSIRSDYVPGVCNIGGDEIRRRQRAGFYGSAATLVVALALGLLGAAPGWYLVLFFPAFAAAIGLVQARLHFCIYFGLAALFNFGREGLRVRVTDSAAQRADRIASYRLIGYSVAIALGVTIVAYGIARAA